MYAPDNSIAQALSQTESHVETFTVTVTDDFGATTSQNVSITVSGSNDGPVISATAQTGAVQEDGTLSASGQVSATDVDHGDHQHYSGSTAGSYGAFTVNPPTGQAGYAL